RGPTRCRTRRPTGGRSHAGRTRAEAAADDGVSESPTRPRVDPQPRASRDTLADHDAHPVTIEQDGRSYIGSYEVIEGMMIVSLWDRRSGPIPLAGTSPEVLAPRILRQLLAARRAQT